MPIFSLFRLTSPVAEKYAVVRGNGVNPGGNHWDYWGKNVYAPFFALHDPLWTDANAVGPAFKKPGDARDSCFQILGPGLRGGHNRA